MYDYYMTVRPTPDFIKSGAIAAKVLSEVVKEVRPGMKVIRICRLADRKIAEYGGKPAFPCNVSIDDEAAHYTSPHGDKKVFPDKGLVKVDLGAHVNGQLSDTAVTIDLDGSYEKFIAAAKTALEKAIEIIEPGVKLGDVGTVIEREIKKHGLRPIHQLSGHQLKPWILHAGKTVPNVGTRRSERMNIGEAFAIEPFSTDGNGTVKGSNDAYIFSNVMSSKKKLDRLSVQIRNVARRRFGTLPWAGRWLNDKKIDVTASLHSLLRAGAIRAYPVLLEGKGGMVAQFEHTVFVAEEGAIVTTLPNRQ